jgi:hypothetical protein
MLPGRQAICLDGCLSRYRRWHVCVLAAFFVGWVQMIPQES